MGGVKHGENTDLGNDYLYTRVKSRGDLIASIALKAFDIRRSADCLTVFRISGTPW